MELSELSEIGVSPPINGVLSLCPNVGQSCTVLTLAALHSVQVWDDSAEQQLIRTQL